MARILITGASGFTGRHLLERLSREGHELHGLEHHSDGSHPTQLDGVHIADLRDIDAIREVIANVQPERVVHLAAIAFVAHGNAAELYATNILGTRNLLEVLSTAAAQPAAVLIASSANVYGNRREGVLDESLPPQPANDYGVTKLAGEALAGVYADRLPIITVRPFNYTGVGQSEKFIIPKIVAHARDRKPVIELGNIDVARDFSDVRFVADSYARLLDTPEAIGGLFNICSGTAHTLSDILAMVEAASGHRMEVQVNPAFVRTDEVKNLCGSPARLESVIGSQVCPSLEETISWMLNADPS